MKKILILFLLCCTGELSLNAQVPVSVPGSVMLHEMQKLKVLGSVLYVAAHPDDENTRLITWLANEKKYRTAYLSLTRGDGGQNLIGDEQGIELGMIRTQELLAARRIDGGEQYFTRAYDFGYSKKPEETFQIWNKDSILADVVWVIRRFRPDVIITRFPTTGEGGHGHHTASAILANEAFQAAADPSRFPEQLKYVSVWQAKRILWNSFNFGGTNTTSSDQFKIDVGGYNSLLGKSYGEIAAQSRSQHKSQGFGVPSTRGESFEFFKTTGGSAPEKELFDGIVTDWSRLPDAAGMEKMIDDLIGQFDVQRPQRSLPDLLKLYAAIVKLSASDLKNYQLARVRELILQAAGLYAEAISVPPNISHGDSLRFNLNLIARSTADLQLQYLTYNEKRIDLGTKLSLNKTFTHAGVISVGVDHPITQPYWLRFPMQPGRFTVPDQQQIGLPENHPAFVLRLGLRIADLEMELDVPVIHKFTDPVRGEIFKPLIVRPMIELSAAEAITFISGDKQKANLSFRLQANQPLKAVEIQARSANMSVELGEIPSLEKGTGLNRIKQATVTPGIYQFQVKTTAVRSFTQAGKITQIQYDHIPEIHYFRTAPQQIRSIDLKIVGKRIGYIEGAGDKVADALEKMGFEVVLLGKKELAKTDLSGFDAIVAGVRAYNTHAWLNDAHDKLMQYVERGGNLIVQYNTSSQIGPVRAKIGPYPFNISRVRVTNESAPVTFVDPKHPTFNYPNKLTAADFDQWIQERSIYHGADTSGRFQRLISMSDPGEKPEDGALLVTRYGKGWFTYTGLALFRQLPAGVPGAYRLLANLIALNAASAHE